MVLCPVSPTDQLMAVLGFPCKGHTGQKYCLDSLGDDILSSLVEKKNYKACCTQLLLLTYLLLVMEGRSPLSI